MNTTLTLSIDDVLKKNIKEYATEKNTDLSYLVSNFFKKILKENKNQENEISPLVKELIGIIPKKHSSEDIDTMHKKYLEEKYLK